MTGVALAMHLADAEIRVRKTYHILVVDPIRMHNLGHSNRTNSSMPYIENAHAVAQHRPVKFSEDLIIAGRLSCGNSISGVRSLKWFII